MLNIKKLKNSFSCAIRGLYHLLKEEQNFQIHTIAAICVLFLSYLLKIDYFEFLVILLVIAFVWFAEIVNTVIEEILDLLHPDYHEKIKIIKDATAGVVLFSSIMAVIIGLIIFYPKLINLL